MVCMVCIVVWKGIWVNVRLMVCTIVAVVN